MRTRVKIIVVLLVPILFGGCASWLGQKADDEAVARVGSSYLYRSELASMMPVGISKADSIGYAEDVVSKWIVTQLKQQEAEKLFEKSEKEIDKLVEEYRRSLLVHRLDRHYLESEPYFEVSDSEISNYYNSHKTDFRIAQPLVKGEIVVMEEEYRRREQMLEWFESSNSVLREDFAESCAKENIHYLQFNDWIAFSEFLSNLPVLRTADHSKLLTSRKTHQILHDKTYYYYHITEVLKVGDTMPLEMVRDKIYQILISRHRADVIHGHEERMMEGAISTKHAEIYR